MEPATAFVATINWGDGTTSSGAIWLSRSGAYSVQGSHAYASGGSHTVTTTVVEAESGGMVAHMMGASSMAIAADNSVPAGSTSSAAVTIQPAALASGPQPLKLGVVDQVLSAGVGDRKGHARLAHSDAASDDLVDDLFAMV